MSATVFVVGTGLGLYVSYFVAASEVAESQQKSVAAKFAAYCIACDRAASPSTVKGCLFSLATAKVDLWLVFDFVQTRDALYMHLQSDHLV
jgi:hypothetical protein